MKVADLVSKEAFFALKTEPEFVDRLSPVTPGSPVEGFAAAKWVLNLYILWSYQSAWSGSCPKKLSSP